MTDYLLPRTRRAIAELLGRHGIAVNPAEVRDPEAGIAADLALPLFRPAKLLKRNPAELAGEIAGRLELAGSGLAAVEPAQGYLNFRFDPAAFAAGVCADFAQSRDNYGGAETGAGRTIVIDYSSPNIAKPFSVGHLRSTIIGQAIKNIYQCLGWRVIGDNHLGDWGTQFGKLLCAFERWGSEDELAADPTGHLFALYVRFHEQARSDPSLEIAAREWFRRLETGDPAARSRWEQFVRYSRAEFDRIYELLGVQFDCQLGESFYADRVDEIVRRALELGVARRELPPGPLEGDETLAADEPVVAIPLDSAGIDVPLLLQKSDGTSLYATRELATAEYRIKTWQPDKILYVVGNEQQLYFRQFSAALKLLGYDTPCIHVNFGLVRLPGGRMSTRAGRVILLKDVIEEAINRAAAVLSDRSIPAEEKNRIARIVGIGAIKYADLSQTRIKEVVFDWDRMLALDGDSAPYLQYAFTRTRSILRKAGIANSDDLPPLDNRLAAQLTTPEELQLLRTIARYPETIAAAAESCEPHRVANRIYRLARDFSAFYDKVPVLQAASDELKLARLYLVAMTGTVIRHGLGLLGIETVERM